MVQAQRVEPGDNHPARARAAGIPDVEQQQAGVKDTTEPAGELRLRVAFSEQSHIGKRKKEQQDAYGHLELTEDPALGRPACYLFVVADGVSMGEAGALASQTAVDVLLKEFKHRVSHSRTDLSEAFAAAFSAANTEVYTLAQKHPGMATTCVAALLVGDLLVTAHTGDSRLYIARADKELHQITLDHSWLTEMGEPLVRAGLLEGEELLHDARRHTITRALGLMEKLQPDMNAWRLENGDLVILCSDGIWDVLPPGTLEQIKADAHPDLSTLSHKLVDGALENGGRDNLTVTLVKVGSLGAPVELPALPKMLERTHKEAEERTNPDLSGSAVRHLASRPFQPALKALGVPAANPEIDDVPSLKLSQTNNAEMTLSKAKRAFSLGDWDEAIDLYIEIERAESSHSGLFESFSAALVRYTGMVIGEGQSELAEKLLKRLESAGIIRYKDMLAEYVLDESRRAAKANHHIASRAYARFCLRLRPNDVSARTLVDLNELYLALQRPRAGLSERLAIAQKIYARDEDFGAIQTDLAQIYMELGDEAVRTGALQDAVGWYSMISPLRPTDSRLLSLAANKLRSVEDDLKRKGISPTNPAGPLPGLNASAAALKSLERERAINDGRPEQEMVGRLKERVSRAQKAWDGGRKEVGSEYIYLVDQLSEYLSPNPWEMTLPRVCYDYGKWLFDQKQFEEARPYFQKAQQLGMTAAQQRINQIDRELKERQNRGRPEPNDLPESQREKMPFIKPTMALPSETPPENKPLKSVMSHRANLFTTRRPANIPDNLASLEKAEAAKAAATIVPPRPSPPQDANFVGASGENSVTPQPPLSVPPRTAATVAAGNWTRPTEPNDLSTLPGVLPIEDDPNRPPVAVSGAERQPQPEMRGANLQNTAKQAAGRVASTGKPQSVNPGWARSQRIDAFLSFARGVLLPGVIVGIIIAGILFALFLIVPNIRLGSSAQNNPTAQTGAVPTAEAISTTLAAPVGPQGVVTLEGVKAANVRVFLATAGDPNSPYRELEADSGNLFRLPLSTLSRLDPRQKYVVVVRPKDTASLKFADNLTPSSPEQQPLTSLELTFDPARGFSTTLKISPEIVGFYPLGLGGSDLEITGGGRYFAATRHSLRGEFLKFYNANGGLGRFGFPISEEFEWTGNGNVQFFERGWLMVEGGKVAPGRVSQALLNSSCNGVPRVPPSQTPVAVPTIKPDADFATAAQTLKLGTPQSPVFETADKVKMQYFEFGRLELSPADKLKKNPPSLGLLGVEYARCIGWQK
jgi:PPM family protein phosphatase